MKEINDFEEVTSKMLHTLQCTTANVDSVTTLAIKIQNIGNDCCSHLNYCEGEVDEDLKMMLKEIIDYANALEVLGDRMNDDIGDVANQLDVMSFDVDED